MIGTLAAGLGTGAVAAVAGDVVLSVVVVTLSGLGAGALETIGPAIAPDAVHPELRGQASPSPGPRAAALFAAPLGVDALLGVAVAPAMALIGAVITVPAIALRTPRAVAP